MRCKILHKTPQHTSKLSAQTSKICVANDKNRPKIAKKFACGAVDYYYSRLFLEHRTDSRRKTKCQNGAMRKRASNTSKNRDSHHSGRGQTSYNGNPFPTFPGYGSRTAPQDGRCPNVQLREKKDVKNPKCGLENPVTINFLHEQQSTTIDTCTT